MPALTEAGFHQLSWRGENARTTLVATSLASDRESDLRERPLPATSPTRSLARKAARPALLDWSWVLALAALLLLLVEITLATKSPTPARGGG